jgi:uncharacterized repeat protein (TIGR03803 family)
VLFGPDGTLYGTTNAGGAEGYGTVFRLQPPRNACRTFLCPWTETVLYSFTNGSDGGSPQYGDLAFDRAGNIYGTASTGGTSRDGVVFKLTRSGNDWTESVVWSFSFADGVAPLGGVIFDNAGNLYGTTSSGGSNGYGTAYELSPTQTGWNETTLYSLGDNGSGAGGLALDAHGDLFGITGDLGPGAAFELTPQNGSWSYTLLQTFSGQYPGPLAAPTVDSRGNLYGPLPTGGSDFDGEIFKLTPSGNGWSYTPFFDFGSYGTQEPIGSVTFDASGNMYGTTASGTNHYGAVWEITP